MNDLYALLDEERILFFPSAYKRSILYRNEEAESVVMRTNAVNAVRNGCDGYTVICTYPEALAEKIVDAEQMNADSLSVGVGDRIAISDLEEHVRSLGFAQVDFVYEPGQYSVRGGIFDIFSYAESRPYRLDFFDDEVFNSNFWLYWRTMFAFENWHSALEMKLYIQRYIHHIGGLPDFTALRFTKYNQYESMILPMVKYLEGFGVQFHFGVQVTNVEFDCKSGRKVAKRIDIIENGERGGIDLTENDLVFITNGGCVENSSMGSQNTPAPYNTEIKEGGGWDMWRKIAAQDPSFGHPDKFCHDPEQTNWMSATVETLDQKIIPYIKNICKRDPFTGHVVTGGIVTVKDSSWLMSWTINRQPQFRDQPKDHCLVWVYSLFTDKPGDSYYFLQWDNTDGLRGFSMGERNFTHEYVFQQLANQIHSTLPGWKPYSPYGLPFSDKGFDGQKRTIEVREIIQLSAGTWRQKRMARKFWLYAISKPYYDYLVSSIINRTDNKGIQGGLIDLGLADPVKIFSNVDGGVGIVGCYTSDSQTIDVIKEIGPFPKY